MAGRGTRLGPLRGPASKEILPLPGAGGGESRPVCAHLFAALRLAGARRAYAVLRRGKWDIPATLGDGAGLGVALSYVVIADSASVPETLDAAFPFVRAARVALGFPDVVALPAQALRAVAERQAAGDAEVALGLFPTDRPDKADMVEVDATGRLLGIEVKPRATARRLTWLYAVWGPAFTAFLHDFLAHPRRLPSGRELAVSDVLLAAREAGLGIATLSFPSGLHLDIGTPEDLARAAALLGGASSPA
jgi:glucose-1-phosphate thymidylyltransferase